MMVTAAGVVIRIPSFMPRSRSMRTDRSQEMTCGLSGAVSDVPDDWHELCMAGESEPQPTDRLEVVLDALERKFSSQAHSWSCVVESESGTRVWIMGEVTHCQAGEVAIEQVKRYWLKQGNPARVRSPGVTPPRAERTATQVATNPARRQGDYLPAGQTLRRCYRQKDSCVLKRSEPDCP